MTTCSMPEPSAPDWAKSRCAIVITPENVVRSLWPITTTPGATTARSPPSKVTPSGSSIRRSPSPAKRGWWCRIVRTTTLEAIAPLYETARLEEQRRIDPVQVVDPAVPPSVKDSPRRSVLVIVATLSALLLSVLSVLLWHLWRTQGRALTARIRREAARA